MELFAAPEENRACNDVLLCQNEFRPKIRQSLSDERSSQKQEAGDMLFSFVRYNCFLSRYVTHSEQRKISRAVKLLKAKYKLPRTGHSRELVFNQWRCTKAADICNSDVKQSNDDGSIDRPGDNLVFFPGKCLFASSLSLWGIYLSKRLSLEPRLNLLKEGFLHSRA